MLTDAIKDAIRKAHQKLKHKLPSYRPRRGQNQMIASVANTLADNGNAIIEAPTGTGKSMAYLIAGIELAKADDKRLVIATATIALQEQLINQDIPRYLELSEHQDLRVALAKGRGRYVCPRNLASAHTSLDDNQMDLVLGQDLALWHEAPNEHDKATLKTLHEAFSHETWQGDLDHAPVGISSSLRAHITTSAGGCTGRACAFFMQCPFFKARRQVEDADVIVANQDLVLSDLMMTNDEGKAGGVILPKPATSFYIIDEGHHLPGKAIRQGASHVYLETARQQLSRLGRQAVGTYSLADKQYIGRLDLDDVQQTIDTLEDQLQQLEHDIRNQWTPNPHDLEPIYRASLGQLPDAWITQAKLLAQYSGKLLTWLSSARTTIGELSEKGRTRDALMRELGIANERIEAQTRTWIAWSGRETQDKLPQARWVTLTAQQQLVCHASQVSAASLLKDILWHNTGACILTSATLSIGGNFRDFVDAIGIPDNALTQSLPSPFDLTHQARLEIPRMEALPNDRDKHAIAISDWLDNHLDWDSGNLVLFTSRAKLERVLQLLPLARVRLIHAQGSRSKAELIQTHTEAIERGEGSTLFGLASFGEGLDLPGKLCQSVVITQLPFAVPTDPVNATYAEWLKTQQRNPFMEVSVPEATRLLIQYCGRLIRNEEDSGRIVILDRRIIVKFYGQGMLNALPAFSRQIER